jgi:hypothetical protein
VIRDAVPDQQGELARAVVELDHDINYAGHYSHDGIRTVVTVPYLLWHRLARLLVTSAHVVVIDASDPAHASNERAIGLATMRLGPRRPG